MLIKLKAIIHKIKNNGAFTLIELLVVIAIIGIISTISVIFVQAARANARDAERVANVRQIQTALELYFNDTNHYPSSSEFIAGQSLYSTSSEGVTTTYMEIIPEASLPADGTCGSSNQFKYIPVSDGASYYLLFCLGNNTDSLYPGIKCLTPDGIISCEDNKTNKSLHFSGYEGYVNIPNSDSLNIENAISLSAWVKIEGGDLSYRGIVTKSVPGGGTGLPNYQIIIGDCGSGEFLFTANLHNTARCQDHISDWENVWHLITGTYDGTTMNLYLDNRLVNSQTFTGGLPAVDDDIIIGAWKYWFGSPGGFFSGKIDELEIWNRALDTGEVSVLFNLGRGNHNTKIPLFNNGLAAGYNFDEGSGDTVHDFSGNNNTGTIYSYSIYWDNSD